MTHPQLDRIDLTLTNAIDLAEAQGAAGTLAVCLFPEGGTLIKAGGLCNDLHGACLSLQATVAALRELALTEQREALAAALQSAAETVQVALQALLPSERH